MDDGWRNMIKDLSKAWGLPVNSTTKVLRTCTIIVWAVMGTTSTVKDIKQRTDWVSESLDEKQNID